MPLRSAQEIREIIDNFRMSHPQATLAQDKKASTQSEDKKSGNISLIDPDSFSEEEIQALQQQAEQASFEALCILGQYFLLKKNSTNHDEGIIYLRLAAQHADPHSKQQVINLLNELKQDLILRPCPLMADKMNAYGYHSIFLKSFLKRRKWWEFFFEDISRWNDRMKERFFHQLTLFESSKDLPSDPKIQQAYIAYLTEQEIQLQHIPSSHIAKALDYSSGIDTPYPSVIAGLIGTYCSKNYPLLSNPNEKDDSIIQAVREQIILVKNYKKTLETYLEKWSTRFPVMKEIKNKINNYFAIEDLKKTICDLRTITSSATQCWFKGLFGQPHPANINLLELFDKEDQRARPCENLRL